MLNYIELFNQLHVFFFIQAYRAIKTDFGYTRIRVIRGDNYCALRSTIYQIMLNKLPVAQSIGNIQEFKVSVVTA